MHSKPNSNFDAAELAKFERLAERWWDPKSEFKPLHDINPLRLEFINAHCRLAGKRVLDVGCGGGILSESMAKLGAEVMGIDMAEAPLAVAQLHAQQSRLSINYQRTEAKQLLVDNSDKFDVVTCLEVLEHVPDPADLVADCAALLKPEGHVFFATINRNPKAFLFAIIGAEYVLNLLPRGTHEYAKFIRPSELSAWSRQAGLELRKLIGMSYNPFSKIYRLEADCSVNYLMHWQR